MALILHLTNKLTFGGKQRFVLSLCKALKHLGVNSSVLCFSSLGPLTEEVKVFSTDVYLKKLVRHGYGPVAVFSFWSFVRYLKSLTFDLAHIHGYPPLLRVGLACIAAEKPYVVQYHSYHRSHGKRLWLFFEKLVLSRAKAAFYVSHSVKDSVVKRCFTEPKVGLVIYNCVDRERPNKLNKKKSYDIVWVARFTTQKRPFDFLEIVRVLSKQIKINACMLGAGDEYQRAKEAATEEKLPIHMPGFVKNIDEVALSKIGVITSEREGISISVLEYLFFGKPVFGYAIPALREVVNEKVGRLFPVGNTKEMAKALRNTLSHQALLKKLSLNALRYSRKFECNQMGIKYAEAYRRVL